MAEHHCYLLALSLLLASSACTRPHIHHPMSSTVLVGSCCCRMWYVSMCPATQCYLLLSLDVARQSFVWITEVLWASSARHFLWSPFGTAECTSRSRYSWREFVWKKRPNCFNLNPQRWKKIKVDPCHSRSCFILTRGYLHLHPNHNALSPCFNGS